MLKIYRASAGSGKTYRLTQDYIHLLFDPKHDNNHRRILAVTFTNKATDEMKTRILKELYALASHEKSDYRAKLMDSFNMDSEQVDQHARKIMVTILHDYSAFQISTIDKFFQQVIRAFARDIGVHGGYDLELDTTDTLEQSVDNLFQDLSKPENKQLLQWLTQFAEEKIEDSKNWNLRGSILSLGREIFKESYQHKAEEANRKLHDRDFLQDFRSKLRNIELEFDKKLKDVATRALSIIEKYGLSHEDFSYKTTKILDDFIGGRTDMTQRFIGLSEDEGNCWTKKTAADLKNTISTAYHDGLQAAFQEIVQILTHDVVAYNSAGIVMKHISTLGILSDLAVQIRKLTGEQNSMLISDTNMLLNRIIDESDTPFVYEKTGIHIENFMIDEFQDTSVLQWKNFHPLIANSLSYDKFNLVVGDVKQSIYRWRNSDWKLLDEKIKTDFRPEQLLEEDLDTNWRSDKQIVAFNNSFFIMAADVLQKKLNKGLDAVLPVYPSLETLTTKISHAYKNTTQHTKPNAGEGFVKFVFIEEEKDQEKWEEQSLERLPKLLEELQERGYKPSDVAMLVKKNKEALSVTRKLLNYKTTPEAREGFVYDVMGNDGLQIAASGAVRFLLGMMQLFIQPDDAVQQTIVNFEYAKAKLGLNEKEALNHCFGKEKQKDIFSPLFTEEENESILSVKNRSLFEMIEKIISIFEIGSWPNEAVFVQAFQDVVFRFSTTRTADVYSFLKWWDKNGEKQCIPTPDQQNAFRITTIHKSKGLDFKVVILPFCDWDLEQKSPLLSSILWCEPKEAPFNELPLLPVEFGKKLGNSIFAEDYYDELMHQYIDNLNVAYVAFTRARHELICMTQKPTKDPENEDKINSISSLIYYCLKNTHLQAMPISGEMDSDNVFNSGKPTLVTNEEEKTEQGDQIQRYPTVSYETRLQIKHQSADFLDRAKSLTDSKLNYGIIMHDVLKQIRYRKDQHIAIETMIKEGRIDRKESEIVIDAMEKFWGIPETAEWFSDEMTVLNEATILSTHGQLYRPDRVVIKDKKAIVVDYKFGDQEKKSYHSQVRDYVELISGMGYETEGYICYPGMGKVVKVLKV